MMSSLLVQDSPARIWAYLLGSPPNNKRVLIIEAGPGLEGSREDYMENFFLNTFKSPSSPYPPNDNGLRPSKTNAPRATIQALVEAWGDPNKSYFTYGSNSLPFASSYERLAGGTSNHWMGTCLRMAPNDLQTQKAYKIGLDWPIKYNELSNYYDQAESLIGVSADVKEQNHAVGSEWMDAGYDQFNKGYSYPMRRIPPSHWDKFMLRLVGGHALTTDNTTGTIVSQTPAGRNSEPYMNRRVCQGNTNCTPICPIQAKYDSQFTLSLAMDTGNVDMISKSVVHNLKVDSATDRVTSVDYIMYEDVSVPAKTGKTGKGSAVGSIFVLAANAVENARIILMTNESSEVKIGGKGGGNSFPIGQHLMDHPAYLAWGLMPVGSAVYGYRGPISTSGIENLRDGKFRNTRAPWRIEIGNEAWNWPKGDPYNSGMDYIYGTNNGGTNSGAVILSNAEYQSQINSILTRQFRVAFLVEQDAESNNTVTLSQDYTDNLGLKRPLINYSLSDYTKAGFKSAREAATNIMQYLGAKDHTETDKTIGTTFEYDGDHYNYQGSGHLCGTHIMGTSINNSCINSYQQVWTNPNLYLVGCGSMPSIGTENPTLTMLALACQTTTKIIEKLT